MPGLQGLSRQYGASNAFGNETKQQLMNEEGGSPINVLSTITPDSLTKMMQRMGQGVGAGAQPAQEPSSTVGGGLQKAGDKPIGEQTKFAGFNKKGAQTYFDNIYGWIPDLAEGAYNVVKGIWD